MGKLKEFSGYAGWWIRARFNHDRPMVTTMITHLGCNLRCKHCNIIHDIESGRVPNVSLSYDAICRDLELRYKQGARLAYFEGGEPTIWHDGDHNLADVINYAKKIGYLNTGYTTNGTGRIFTESSTISVSLDGPREIHDRIRQEGVFDKLMENLKKLEDYDGSVFANMVIQKDNWHYLREVAEIVRDNPSIDGIVFNFLTPPPTEPGLNHEERVEAVETLKKLKEEGFPVLNSKKGLELLKEEDWSEKCPYGMTAFTTPTGEHINGCPMRVNEGACQHCGFAAVREYYLVNKGSPSTIMELAPTFAMTGKNKKKQ